MDQKFAYFSLEGDRFNGPGMPVDVAREVGTYRSIILSVARNLWLTEHPERAKVPNGFSDAFDLRLVSIDTGSAQPTMVLERPESLTTAAWAELELIFTASRDLTTEAIADVSEGQPLPARFPRQSVNELRKLGATLKDAETLTLGAPQPQARRARLDQEARETLEDLASTTNTPPQEIELTGIIVQFNGEHATFGLRTDRNVSKCSIDNNPRLAKKAKDYLAIDGLTAPEVRVTGLTKDPAATAIALIDTQAIEVIHSATEHVIIQRIRGFEKIRPGEMGPGSIPPIPDVRRHAENLVPAIDGIGIPVLIAPTTQGGITMEWTRGDLALSLDLDPAGEIFLCVDNTTTDDIREYTGPYDHEILASFLTHSELP